MATIANLPKLVRAKFKVAQTTGDLTFYQTKVSILRCNGLPFQIRFSPALANKPKSNRPKNPNEPPFDPFASPSEGLFIAELNNSHNLVLNKFPVIPDHFILATKEYKEQRHLLEDEDLSAAYSCLKSYHDDGEELFGFFNSGEHSGASQPHRHIQFLPIESMRSGMNDIQNWVVLVNNLLQNPELPFTYFIQPLPEAPTSQQLFEIYITLHQQSSHLILGPGHESVPKDAESPISYNLGMTRQAMILCPRTAEGTKIKSNTGEYIGPVSLNGTILGGTLLVKSEEEWDALRSDESQLENILKSIGHKQTVSIPNESL